MPCSACGSYDHNVRTCPEKKGESVTDAESLGSEGKGEKRTLDTQSPDGVVVAAQRPRLSGAPPPSSQAPAKPEKIWEFFETSAASSPVEIIKLVVPYVDHVLFLKMSRCFFCKWKNEFSQKTFIDESHPSPQPNFGQC